VSWVVRDFLEEVRLKLCVEGWIKLDKPERRERERHFK
jgi:hypothetical protein